MVETNIPESLVNNGHWLIKHSFIFLVTIIFLLSAKGNLYPEIIFRCLHVNSITHMFRVELIMIVTLLINSHHFSLVCQTLKLTRFFPVQRTLILSFLCTKLPLPTTQPTVTLFYNFTATNSNPVSKSNTNCPRISKLGLM